MKRSAFIIVTFLFIVLAAFAIQVMEPEMEIEECIAIARQSLESGRALETLKKFIEINQ